MTTASLEPAGRAKLHPCAEGWADGTDEEAARAGAGEVEAGDHEIVAGADLGAGEDVDEAGRRGGGCDGSGGGLPDRWRS
jgi:hypothetical protein